MASVASGQSLNEDYDTFTIQDHTQGRAGQGNEVRSAKFISITRTNLAKGF